VGIINSQGLEAKAKKTVFSLSGLAVAAEGGDEVSWYDCRGGQNTMNWMAGPWDNGYREPSPFSPGRSSTQEPTPACSPQGALVRYSRCSLLLFSRESLQGKTRLKEKEGPRSFPICSLSSTRDQGRWGIPL